MFFVNKCCCPSDSESDDEGRNTPLLSRESPPPAMPRPRTYGKKKASTSTVSSSIFGTESPRPSRSQSVRSPLEDVTNQLSNVRLQNPEEGGDDDDARKSSSPSPARQSVRHEFEGDGEINGEVDEANVSSHHPSSTYSSDSAQNSINQAVDLSPDDLALQPLTHAYKVDRNHDLPITSWAELLPAGATVVKIAEASFAEVYRVTVDGRDSILKVMQLKVPSDPSSLHSYTAIKVENVASEIRLMNALTEYPSFVKFKEAHLVQGKPANAIINACQHSRWNPATQSSYFPDPSTFSASSLFLAIELQDAGKALDDVGLTRIDEVWDVLLGVILALAHAEHCLEFEHRDLHENNICIAFGEPSAVTPSSAHQKYGFSGIKVTILDYGLSRAKLQNGDEVFCDLEEDLEVFRGSPGNPQFDTYRRMRTHLFTGGRTMFKKGWHDDSSKNMSFGHTWKEFTPYTNVLWIKYILGYLKKNFKEEGNAEELRKFEMDTSDLKTKLNPLTKVENGAFSTAKDVYEYVCQKEWFTLEQLVARNEGSSFLSDDN